MFQPRSFVAMDGTLVLQLETAEEGGYVVTCPFEPALVTEAEKLEEAFENAADVVKLIHTVRGTKRRKRGVRNRKS
jgi:predicted RNase H-like HicB family nuclease